MKKIYLIFAVLLVSNIANASYLYWQLDLSDTDYAGTYTGAKIVNGAGTPYTIYGLDVDENGELVRTTISGELKSGVTYAIEYDEATQSENSYVVELYNAGAKIDTDLYTTTPITGQQLYQYASTGGATSSLQQISTASVATWHGDGTMVNAPEPTSAILILFGAAMLGLKRKQRRLA